MFSRTLAWITVLLGLSAGLLIAGCAVGPDYHPPQTTMPSNWVGPAPQVPPQPSPAVADLTRWWKGFGDPALSSLVDRAVRSNLDVRQAQSRLVQSRASRGVAAAGLGPNAGLSAGFTRTRNGGGPKLINNLYQVGLDAGWEIDVFGGVRRNVEASTADVQAAQEDLRNTLVSLTAEVALDYIDLRGFQQEIVIAQENLKAQRHTADLTRAKQRGGLVGALDVANADALVATTAAQIPVLRTSARQTIYSLSLLLGREPGALLKELSLSADIPSAPPTGPLGVPSILLRRRPDIRRAEAQVHAATARIGVATAALFPTFNLNGSFSFQDSKTNGWLDWRNRLWSFGPSANWSFFNSGANLWSIEVQNALTQQALLTYEQTVLTAMQDVENALVASANEQEHRKALMQAVAANQKAVELATQLYAQGQTDFLNVLDAQRSLYASQDALVQSTRDISTDMVALYKALGGGWSEADGAEPRPSRVPFGAVLNQISGGQLARPEATTKPAK
jgi:NodT family efflux transporter outer membrane factor (OMF) lipoprotein